MNATRWVIVTLAAILVIGLLVWGGGDVHHHGDEVGAIDVPTAHVLTAPR